MKLRLLYAAIMSVGLFSFIALFGLAPAALAQTNSTGALTGTVTDASGGVVVGATVTITNLGTGQERTATTGSDGVYKITLLNPGNYKVSFSAAGFKSAEVSSV